MKVAGNIEIPSRSGSHPVLTAETTSKALDRRRRSATMQQNWIQYLLMSESDEPVVTAERVTQMLRDNILAGAYPDGSALRQERLASELGCSRIPIREALRQLEAEGLVVTIPRRGAMVAEMSADRIRESFELRAVIEPWLLSEAIPRLGEEDFATAEAVIQEMRGLEIDRWSEANWRFHAALYGPSGKETAMGVVRSIHDTVDRYLRVHLKLTSGQDKAHKEHTEILELCRARHVHRASVMLARHIQDVADKLVESVSLARSLRTDEHRLHPARRERVRRVTAD